LELQFRIGLMTWSSVSGFTGNLAFVGNVGCSSCKTVSALVWKT